jgi:hypothetical protein
LTLTWQFSIWTTQQWSHAGVDHDDSGLRRDVEVGEIGESRACGGPIKADQRGEIVAAMLGNAVANRVVQLDDSLDRLIEAMDDE